MKTFVCVIVDEEFFFFQEWKLGILSISKKRKKEGTSYYIWKMQGLDGKEVRGRLRERAWSHT